MQYNAIDERTKEYLNRIEAKSAFTLGRNWKVVKLFLACCDVSKCFRHNNKLTQALWTEDTSRLSAVFSGARAGALTILLGREWADKFKLVWDRLPEYTYARGMLRRSFRTKENEHIYLDQAVDKLFSMVALVANNFSYQQYFDGKGADFNNLVLPDLLALELDSGNEYVSSRIREIVYGNNTGQITREVIKAMVMSHNVAAHGWLGDLLLAARLQEGLRQSIVHYMDEGSKSGFIYLLKVILDNELYRFSSVVRSLDVWTGLGIVAQKPKVIEKCLSAGYNCLVDPQYRSECLASADNLIIYMGLWALGVDEVADSVKAVDALLREPEKYKRLTALYFLSQVQIPKSQHIMAASQLVSPDWEVKAWALANLFPEAVPWSLGSFTSQLNMFRDLDGACSQEQLFFALKGALDAMPRKKMTFKESVFSWGEQVVAWDNILLNLFFTVALKPSAEYVDLLLDYRDKMNADIRSLMVEVFLDPPATAKQKTALVEMLGDRSCNVRERTAKVIGKLRLSSQDYKRVENLLHYKSGDLRKIAIAVLMRQPPRDLLSSIRSLVESGDEAKGLAALDIIAAVDAKLKYRSIMEKCRNLAVGVANTSQQAKVMADKINPSGPVYTRANGFGLFDPHEEIPLPAMSCSSGFLPTQIFASSPRELQGVLWHFSNLVHQHRDLEYEIEAWDGGLRKVVLGSSGVLSLRQQRNSSGLANYPLAAVWRRAAVELQLTARQLLELVFYLKFSSDIELPEHNGWYDRLIFKCFPGDYKAFKELLKSLKYPRSVRKIIAGLAEELPKAEVFALCRDIISFVYLETPLHRFKQDYCTRKGYSFLDCSPTLVDAPVLIFWLNWLRDSVTDSTFEDYFYINYTLYKASGFRSMAALDLPDFERAWTMGLVSENELYAEVCGRPFSALNLREITNPDSDCNKQPAQCRQLKAISEKVIERVLDIELKRGDLNTKVSFLAARIYKIRGARFFVQILIAMEKETYVRGDNFVSGDSTKRQIFSHLLKHCYPAEGEGAQTLASLLKQYKVTQRQLVDAAMYAPQWLGMVEDYLEWPGLKSAGWYFHAHVNENFSAEKESIVAGYSPVSPQDFVQGAFDIKWFKESHSVLGEKRFRMVYDSAKYIAGGGLHKRSQLFTDAVLGKMDIARAEGIISAKRNKNYVLCYGLLPLPESKEELVRRYEFLQRFLKESRQLGAQRRESEGTLVKISLENLARNAGFSDASRFTWYMETEKMQTVQRFLKPAAVEDITVQIVLDESGHASLEVIKNGRPLKTVPTRFRANPYIVQIRETVKSLREQHARARRILETAMVAGEEFTLEELSSIESNPVIYPLLRTLVFRSGENLGYYSRDTLTGPVGLRVQLNPGTACTIAHPVHLYDSGQWSAFQRDVFERKLVQPFKQVFRELYRPNADELESGIIRRYAGHQVQPRKAVALLNSRGWTASYQEGVQKVYHDQGIVANIYVQDDLFAPSDVEAPTLEIVNFTWQKTGQAIPIAHVPPLVFSETMRDLDLVVSVAHAGNVDPEASLTTIEMRRALIAEMLRLLRLNNVELKGTHAGIDGTLAAYTVHLGSGIVHQVAGGAINILPVHSQHRGRIFLPFIDDDPKTAEITTKVVMLAEDSKIKDPGILEQIRK